jgi:hypothetical protein
VRLFLQKRSWSLSQRYLRDSLRTQLLRDQLHLSVKTPLRSRWSCQSLCHDISSLLVEYSVYQLFPSAMDLAPIVDSVWFLSLYSNRKEPPRKERLIHSIERPFNWKCEKGKQMQITDQWVLEGNTHRQLYSRTILLIVSDKLERSFRNTFLFLLTFCSLEISFLWLLLLVIKVSVESPGIR